MYRKSYEIKRFPMPNWLPIPKLKIAQSGSFLALISNNVPQLSRFPLESPEKDKTYKTKIELLPRGVSGFLKVGGQVVIQVVMRRGAAAGGAFYSAKKCVCGGGGICSHLRQYQGGHGQNESQQSCNTMKAYANGSISRQYFFDTTYFHLLLGLRSWSTKS